MLKIMSVVGARPNFMKIAPLIHAMNKRKRIQNILVHTGQHYDRKMSKLFFDELDIPKPDINLGVGSGTHAQQTAQIMSKFEGVVTKFKPDLILVVGDVNSTIACSLTAAKLNIPIAHVEAGLRSFDRRMPEEVNRILTDAISDILFTTCREADDNLRKEGIPQKKIFFVGNVMIDTLVKNLKKAENSKIIKRLGLENQAYGLVTLHRPSNVDDKKSLREILKALCAIQEKIKIVFPAHPRTMKKIKEFSLLKNSKGLKNLILLEPLGYLDFLRLMSHSKLVFTDSGGLQEETTFLNIPCLTLRKNTERPITITHGTNVLVGVDSTRIIQNASRILKGHGKRKKKILFWDGKASERIAKILSKIQLKEKS